jgi:hypothetical protein
MEEAEPVLESLFAQVWSAGTRHGHAGRTVTVKTKYADFGRSPTAVPGSSRSAPRRSCGESAWNCIAHVFLPSRCVRLLRVTISNLEAAQEQSRAQLKLGLDLVGLGAQ